MVPVYVEHHTNRVAAVAAHKRIVESILDRSLQLSIPITYAAWESYSGDNATPQTQNAPAEPSRGIAQRGQVCGP